MFTQIVDQEKKVYHLCRACADQQTGTGDSVTVSLEPERPAGTELICPACGMTFEEFQKGGRFGCAACYGAFEPALDSLLKRIHGAFRHRGAAVAADLEREKLAFLERQLQQAVVREAYEEAARARDLIAQLKAQSPGI